MFIRLALQRIRTCPRRLLATARLCALVAVSSVLAACGGSSSQSQPFKLLTTGTLHGGENTSLSFEAPAGLLVLRVQQSGADLSVALRYANGSVVNTANSPGRRVGSEYVTWRAPKAGSYIAVISAVQTGTPGGGFSAQLLELENANKHLQAGFAFLSDAFALNARTDADKKSIAKLLEASLSSFRRARYRQGMWETAHQLASLNFWDRYQWQEAMRYAELSLEYADEIGDKGAVAHALMLKGAIGIEMANAVTQTTASDHRLRSTEATLERAAQMHRQLGNRFAEAECLNFLAMSSYAQSNLGRAATLLREVASTYAALGERANEVMALQSLQSLDLQNGNYRIALRTLEQLLQRADRKDDPVFYAGLMNEYGLALSLSGEPDEAIRQLIEASQQYARIDRPQDSADSLQMLATVYRRQGDIEQALDLMTQVLDIRHAFADNTRSLFSSLTITSDLLREAGRTLEARRMAAEALPLAQRATDVVRINLVMARVAMQFGAYDEAEAALQTASATHLPPTHRYHLETLLERSRLLIATHRHDPAIALLADAERLSKDANAVYEQSIARYLTALALSEKTALPAALLAAEETVDMLEALRSATVNPDLRSTLLASRRDAYRLRVEVLMRMSEALLREGKEKEGNSLMERALIAADSSRARVVRELAAVRLDARDSASVTARQDLYLDLAGKRYRYDQLRERESLDHGTLDRLGMEIASLRVRLDQLPGELVPTRYNKDFDLASLRKIQAQIEPDTVVVEYMLASGRSWAWIVRRSGIVAVELPSREIIEEAAQTLINGVRAPRTSADTKIASNLARLIVEPLAEHLAGYVIFVPDGALLQIPLALVVDASGARERTTGIATSPAVAMLTDRPHSDSSAPSRILLVSGASRDSAMPSLPAASREVNSIREIADGRSVTLLQGLDSERSRVLKELAGGHEIVHFATHALVDARDYRLSSILLASENSDGTDRIYLSDLERLNLANATVVLSACETASGRMLDGEGMLGFSSTFLAAGASHIVLSYWRVPDNSTAELVQIFYSNLLRHQMTPDEALLRAQFEFRSRFHKWSHPYYWAGFGVITQVLNESADQPMDLPRVAAQ